MSSRVSLQHFVSTSEPTGVTVGDEWYNPSTGILYKRIASSLGVRWINISGLGATTTTSTSTSSSATVSAAFDQANTATIIANAAFDRANTSSGGGGGSTIDPFMLAGM